MADINAFFDEYLPKKLKDNPELGAEINAIYVFDLEGHGHYTVDLTTGDGGTVAAGTHEEPGCTVTCTAEDFEQLLDNPAMGMMLFTMGKLKVSNVGLAIPLQKLLS